MHQDLIMAIAQKDDSSSSESDDFSSEEKKRRDSFSSDEDDDEYQSSYEKQIGGLRNKIISKQPSNSIIKKQSATIKKPSNKKGASSK